MQTCPNCFGEINSSICNICGYDSSVVPINFLLPPLTELCDRYRIGVARDISVLTITYIGFDTLNNRTVYVEEFFPTDIAFRSGVTVSHSDRHNITYKTMLSDLHERWIKLSKIRNKCLPEIYDIVYAGGTVYCIYEHHPKKTLEELISHSQRLAWSDIKPSFMQLFSLVSKLNSLGISHCGISPSNIWVLPDNSLILKGFSLPEVRTAGNMLKSELFSGYSAPEQYHRNMWQGEWTDVYSLGAVLYYVLSGNVPINSDSRLDGEVLARLDKLKLDIPQNVVFAVSTAMSTSIKERFPTVDAFSAALLSEASSSTVVFSIAEQSPAKPKSKAKRIKEAIVRYATPAIISLVLVSIIAIFSILANILILLELSKTQAMLSEQKSSTQASVPTNPAFNLSFVGMHKDTIVKSMYPHLSIDFVYEYNDDLPADIIIEQSVLPNDPVPVDGKLTLTVSKGSRKIKMPYLIGSTRDFAGQTLTNMGVRYSFEMADGLDNSYPSGTVIGMSRSYGEEFDKENDEIILTIKK